jgi:integrase
MWGSLLKKASAEIAKRKLAPLPEGLVLYSCRHTFATHFLSEGGDIGQLSRILGHADIQTTMRYVHRLQASKAAAIVNKRNERKVITIRKRA